MAFGNPKLKINEQPQYTSESGEVILYKGLLENPATVDEYLSIEDVAVEAIRRGMFLYGSSDIHQYITINSSIIKKIVINEAKYHSKLLDSKHFSIPYGVEKVLKEFNDKINIKEFLENPLKYNNPLSANMKHRLFDDVLVKNLIKCPSENKYFLNNNYRSPLSCLDLTKDAVETCVYLHLNPCFIFSKMIESKLLSEVENKKFWETIILDIIECCKRLVYRTVIDISQDELYQYMTEININHSKRVKNIYNQTINEKTFQIKENFTEDYFIEIIISYLDYVFSKILYYYKNDIIVFDNQQAHNTTKFDFFAYENAIKIIVPIIYSIYIFYGTLQYDQLPDKLRRYLNRCKLQYSNENLKFLSAIIEAFIDQPPI
ncbi:hypothetical protein PBI_SCTP2_24 [Salicola phage SCTP-2]|nr:hypothetical protein PBI_SCTP2_24 [Salicola phage SCTP-2]